MTEKKTEKKQIDKKDFVLNELHKIYLSYAHLSRTDRILSYINHFCEHFKYDTKTRDSYFLSHKHTPETFAQNEQDLFNLLSTGSGVCMQFAQALCLLSAIDNSISRDMPLMMLAVGLIQTQTEPKVGHVINLIFLRKKEPIVIDISSMLHARDGEFKQSKMAFAMVYLDEYIQNLQKEDVQFIPIENGQSLQCYGCNKMTPSEIYDFLNTPVDEMKKSEKEKIFYYNFKKTK